MHSNDKALPSKKRSCDLHISSNVEAVQQNKKPRVAAYQKELMRALKNSDIAILESFLDKEGVDVNTQITLGKTALILAASKGYTAKVQLLLDRGADPNIKDSDGWTATMYAATRGYENIVCLLIDQGADVSATTSEGWTAFMIVVLEQDTAMLQVLLDKGANINASTPDGTTALIIATQGNYAEVVQFLLGRGANVESTVRSRWTAFMIAAYNDYPDIVQLFLDKYPEISTQHMNGVGALMHAAEKGNIATLQAFLDHGVDINISDASDWTALRMAAVHGHRETVQFLLIHGADMKLSHGDWAGLVYGNQPGEPEGELEDRSDVLKCLSDFNPLSCLEQARKFQEAYFSKDNNPVAFESVVRQFKTLDIYVSDEGTQELCIRAQLELGCFYEHCEHIALAKQVFELIPAAYPELYQDAQSRLAQHALGNMGIFHRPSLVQEKNINNENSESKEASSSIRNSFFRV